MKTRRFDHIDLRVKDMVAAQRFYGQLLPALGFSVASGDDELRTYQCPGEGPEEFFCFEEGTDHRPNETRIAFWAESRAEVDRLTEIVRRGRRLEAGRAGGVARILARLLCGFLRGSEREQA